MCRKQKNKENHDKRFVGRIKGTEESDNFSKSMYEKAEDNAAYQELGEITIESQYDKLPWQHSHYIRLQICKNSYF